uniref:B9 domain-containing protein 2 n=1 Tax=Amazona collaria TaxID=241587 RepID=A0A8B9F957_9PSIT
MSLPCPYHVLTLSLSCPCHVLTMSLPCSYHVLTMSLPCPCHVHAMSMPCPCHVLTMSLPCPYHVLTMSLPCPYHVHVLTMSLPCPCHVLTMSLPCPTCSGWPRLHVQVWHQDTLGRCHVLGYGFCHVPSAPGAHSVRCVTWRPLAGWRDRARQRWVGGGARLAQAQEAAAAGGAERFRLRSEAGGSVHLELGVVLRHFRLGTPPPPQGAAGAMAPSVPP